MVHIVVRGKPPDFYLFMVVIVAFVIVAFVFAAFGNLEDSILVSLWLVQTVVVYAYFLGKVSRKITISTVLTILALAVLTVTLL